MENAIDPSIFEIEQRKQKKPYNMDLKHAHNSFEIYYMVEGERYYFIRDRMYLIKAGDLVFINANDLHKTMQVDNIGHQRILINFQAAFIEDIGESQRFDYTLPFNQHPILRLTIQEQAFVHPLLKKMLKESATRRLNHQLYLQMLLIELLIFAVRRFEDNKDAPHLTFPPSLNHKIFDIVTFINANYMHVISLASLSEQFQISPYYLSRTFKKVTGFSFSNYLNLVRIKEAQKRLTTTEMNVMDVAQSVGYDNQTHFGRVFKALTNTSPLQYRKSNKMS